MIEGPYFGMVPYGKASFASSRLRNVYEVAIGQDTIQLRYIVSSTNLLGRVRWSYCIHISNVQDRRTVCQLTWQYKCKMIRYSN